MPTITLPYGRTTLDRDYDLIEPREAEAAPDQAVVDNLLGEATWGALAALLPPSMLY